MDLSGFKTLTYQGKILRFLAGAEQAKATGGMVALYPRTHDAQKLVVPQGEPLEDLHCTVVYLGEDVTGQDPTELVSQLDYVTGNYGPIEANVFGTAVFNPDSPEPASVYLVGGNPDITRLYSDLKRFVTERYPDAQDQHDPYHPHITGAYGEVTLGYQGPVLFDRIGLRWPGHNEDFIL